MNRQWLILGSLVTSTGLAVACAQKVGSSGASTAAASGTSAQTGSTTSGMGGATTSTTTSGTGGMGPCLTPPTKLFPPKMGTNDTIYCPFSGMPNIYCTKLTQHCCQPSTGMSKCVDAKTICDANSTDWTCQDPTDCPMGQKCCSTDGATLVINPNINCANYATGFKGTVCAATCSATQITMCTDDGACGTTKKCTMFKTKGATVGGCN